MVDSVWLKHLAEANLSGGRWSPKDQESIAQLTQQRMRDAIDLLAEEASESVRIHNEHAGPQRKVRFVAMPPRPPEHGGGFKLLLGRHQVSLSFRLGALIATLTTPDGFALSTREMHRFLPHADDFGSVVWSQDNALLMTPELIIKRLLEDLTRAALEAADT